MTIQLTKEQSYHCALRHRARTNIMAVSKTHGTGERTAQKKTKESCRSEKLKAIERLNKYILHFLGL